MTAVVHRVAIVAFAAAAAGACLAPVRDPLRVGSNPWPGYEYLHLAEHLGYFAAEGVEVRLLEFGSLSDTRRAYERGQLDMMGATAVEALVVRDRSSRSPEIVRIVDYSNGADVILAQPWITGPQALHNARVGVELGALPAFLLARGLEHLGVDPGDVRPSSLDQTAMEEAFRQGALDAIVTYPPTSIRLMREFKASPLFSSAMAPREILDVLVAEADVIRDRRQDVAAVLRAFDRAQAFAETHPAEAYAVMAAREGLTPEEFAAALHDGVGVVTTAEQAEFFRAGGPLERSVAHADRLLRRSGQLRNPPRTAGLISRVFVPEAEG